MGRGQRGEDSRIFKLDFLRGTRASRHVVEGHGFSLQCVVQPRNAGAVGRRSHNPGVQPSLEPGRLVEFRLGPHLGERRVQPLPRHGVVPRRFQLQHEPHSDDPHALPRRPGRAGEELHRPRLGIDFLLRDDGRRQAEPRGGDRSPARPRRARSDRRRVRGDGGRDGTAEATRPQERRKHEGPAGPVQEEAGLLQPVPDLAPPPGLRHALRHHMGGNAAPAQVGHSRHRQPLHGLPLQGLRGVRRGPPHRPVLRPECQQYIPSADLQPVRGGPVRQGHARLPQRQLRLQPGLHRGEQLVRVRERR